MFSEGTLPLHPYCSTWCNIVPDEHACALSTELPGALPESTAHPPIPTSPEPALKMRRQSCPGGALLHFQNIYLSKYLSIYLQCAWARGWSMLLQGTRTYVLLAAIPVLPVQGQTVLLPSPPSPFLLNIQPNPNHAHQSILFQVIREQKGPKTQTHNHSSQGERNVAFSRLWIRP